jgi:hypothetical protein
MQRAVHGETPFQKPAFRGLRKVSMSHLPGDGDAKGSFTPSQLLTFFRFSSMRLLSAESVVEQTSTQSEDQESTTEDCPSTEYSSISEIHLTSSNGSKGMQNLISSCSSLKSFKYQHCDNHLFAEGYQPSAFYRTLEGSKNSLETLWLDTHGSHLPFTITGANESHDEWFGSLADFTTLKDIRIRLPNLLDVRYQLEPSSPLPDLLPRSMESLYIEGCKEVSLTMLLAQIKLVLGKHQSRFPNLRTLDVEGFFHDDEYYEDSGYEASTGGEKSIKPRILEMAEPLHSACAEVGISLNIRDRDCPVTMIGPA